MIAILKEKKMQNSSSVFGSWNEVVYRHLTVHFFVWFVGWNELIYHHLIPRTLIISTRIKNEVIPINLRNKLMMHHLL